MKTNSIIKMFDSSVIWVLVIFYILCSNLPVLGQSNFSRNDNYDFTGKHYIRAFGSDLNNFSIKIESNSDFHNNFKLHVIKSRLDLAPDYFANKYQVDMNNDGTWEQGWTTSNEKTISYNYPNPGNGISENHTIKIEIDYSNGLGQHWQRTKYHQVTVFSTPRVYVNAEDDVFIQLRNEDCTSKIPVLLVEGFDPLNEKYPETYYNLTWDLVNSDLYPNGYEVFILNFHDAGRDLRLNADVLIKNLEKIHEICPNYQIAVGGLSMGGPITRYALAKKEDENDSHNVGLFMSYDSPQDGAHVSPDLQDWIKIQNPNEGAIGELQDNLESVAAKQMLRYNTYDPDHTFRYEFYNELNALNGNGYPHQSYNVAVGNGNLNATWGNGSVGRHLMTLKINDFLIKDVPAVEFDCETGSMMTDITMTRYGDVFPNPFMSIYYELSIIFNPAYIPTWSALDLVNWDDDPFGNITSFDSSKFDDYVLQATPLQHHELSTVTRNKIMDWLDLDFNIEIEYDLFEGGSTNSDNYQVNILRGSSIEILPITVNVNGQEITYKFYHWWDGSTQNPRIFYTSHDITKTVYMKGHLCTSQPSQGDSKNQRRVVSFTSPSSGNIYWNMIYESGGDIWYSWSTDGGDTWGEEVRMNFRQGKAKNPSLSNVFTFNSGSPSDWGRFIITWVEEDENGYPRLHLQTMKAGYLHYGWSNYSNPERDKSHRLVNSPDFEIKADARPVVELVREGDNVRMYAAFEDNYRNIHVGTILFEGNGYNSVEDLYQASSWQMYWDYWNPPPLPAAGSKYPVLIHQPPVYSDEINYLYYIEPVNEEQSKVTQYNLTTLEKEYLESPLDCYEFYSLQGTISEDNGMIGLTAHTRIFAGLPRVVFYKKYPHEDFPGLNTVFVGMSSPSIMSENNSGYSTFISEILMNSTDGGWYRSNGYEQPEYVTSCASGVYTRENVPQEDRASVFTRTATIPAKLEYYEGTGELEKIVHPVFWQRAFRFGVNNSHQQKTVVLDFAGTKVRMLDTLENRKTIAAIKLHSLSANGFIVRQPDSLVTPLGIDLVRNGQTIRSYAVAPWDSLTIHSIPGIRPGDILLFKTANVLTKRWGYNEFILRRSGLNKTSSRVVADNSLELKALSVSIYPNPFNPSTTFRINLPKPARVHLEIYNILGQKVLTLLNGNLPAGETEVLLNGNKLSSGIYFYRLNTDKKVKTGRLLLMK